MSKQRLTSTDRRAIGRRLKVAREGVHLTQHQAARRLGLRVTTTLSNYEQGRVEVPLRLLPSLCVLYRIKIETLLLGHPQADVTDLDTRRRYARIQDQGQELLRELARLVHKLETLFESNNNQKRRARG